MSGERTRVATIHRENGAYLVVLNDTLPCIEDMTVWDLCSAASSLHRAKQVAREMAPGAQEGFGGPVRWFEERHGAWEMEMTVGDPDEDDEVEW